jgi:hypothetical protein
VIKSVYFLENVKKRELLRKTNYNFIKIDLNFPATLASPSFELATLGIERKTLNPIATEAYTIKNVVFECWQACFAGTASIRL